MVQGKLDNAGETLTFSVEVQPYCIGQVKGQLLIGSTNTPHKTLSGYVFAVPDAQELDALVSDTRST
ncbi:MAG: hypothetical protein HC848_00750 [Limnobacter sp.]|nr:hypothetical protein [Limnobacter sp.]